MESIFSLMFDEALYGKEYKSQDEYISDCIKRVELLLWYYIGCVTLMQENSTEEKSDANFENNSIIIKNRNLVLSEFNKVSSFIESRREASGEIFFALEYILIIYKLNDLEFFCLMLSLMTKISNKYEDIFAMLQNDKDKKGIEYDLALRLFYFMDEITNIENIFSVKEELESKMSSLCFEPGTMNIDDRLLSFILSNGQKKIGLNGINCIIPMENSPLPIMEDIANKMCSITNSWDKEESIYFNLFGPSGSGKKTLVQRYAQIMGIAVVMVDLNQIYLLEEKDFYNTLLTICRETIIGQGVVCFCNFDVFSKEDCPNKIYENLILNTVQRFTNVCFLLTNKEDRTKDRSEYVWIDVPISYPSKEESIKLWEICLSGIKQYEDVKAFEMANKFTFTPGQIMRTKQQANRMMLWKQDDKLTKKEIYTCAYKQIVHDLEKQATLIYAKYNWDDLILPDTEKVMLMNACNQIIYKHVVYNNWGFEKRLAYGKGVSMLFAGPPGTGKTMAARVVANALGIEIYKVNLSQIMSKYIGETEKNLNVLFDEAKKSNVILFFDETDALFGKRTAVKDSHDKNANLETSYLLQKMEEYDGITVMTTNYLENIDSAFFRRISYVIHFPFPDVESRKMIWQNMYPKEVPMSEDIDFDYLAKQFELAGGNIKNVAVTSAFLAAKNNSEISMKHILLAIKYELTKQGKTLLKEDFGEFAYMLDK